MQIKTINIKEFFPDVSLAVANFEIEIERSKIEKICVLKVIHGYGSHGFGGAIKKEIRKKCEQFLKERKIKNYVSGEMWGNSNLIKSLQNDFPELVLDTDLKNFNNGITLILI